MRVTKRPLFLYLVPLVTTWALVNVPPSGLSAIVDGGARVTQVTNSVQLLHPPGLPQRASVNDVVGSETVVRTGKDSRAELTCSNQTVVRLAAHTEFNFHDGTRRLDLKTGAALVQAPKKANGAIVRMGEVAGTVGGTTVMIEYHPGAYKFLVLEGTARLYRPGHLGDSILLQAGQMVIGNPDSAISDPVDVDIGNFMTTSRFITNFPALPNEKTILGERQKQQQQKLKKNLIETNLVIFGGGTQVSVIEQEKTDETSRRAATLLTSRRASNPNSQASPGTQ
ncbi:MAG TPA: FecR family protein [Candidatus Udaeobacter sp.]|jgi:hypothetical protein|nr:FecR family protein [Candidatus Udaeobacter sp.]